MDKKAGEGNDLLAKEKRLGTIIIVASVLLVGGCVYTQVTSPEEDPSKYPSCASIAPNPGTSSGALCADDGKVIKVRNYKHWPR